MWLHLEKVLYHEAHFKQSEEMEAMFNAFKIGAV